MNKLGTKALILFLLKYIAIALIIYIFFFFLLALADAGLFIVSISFVVCLGFGCLWSWLSYKNYVYAIDERGIIIEKGVISKHKVIIPYRNIQNIDVPRTLIDRILGLSHLKIQTAADPYGYEGIIPNLDNKVARELQEEILDVVNRTKS